MEKKEDFITVDVKGFWGQLFCRHDYEDIGKKIVYNSTEDLAEDLPSQVFLRFMCKKCAKVRKIEL